MKTKTKKRWTERLPEIYKDIVISEANFLRPDRDITKQVDLSYAFAWAESDYGYDFFRALHCQLEGYR